MYNVPATREGMPVIPDHQTNTVYLADTLWQKHNAFASGFEHQMQQAGLAVESITGTRDIWCRDYMPIQLAAGRFIQFKYDPPYLEGDTKWITPAEVIQNVPPVRGCGRSDTKVEGGNVIRWSDKAILTDRVFEDNPGFNPQELATLLEVDQLIIIPQEPGDTCGHADGILRFIDGETVLVNDYSKVDCPDLRDYGGRLLLRLQEEGLGWVLLPYAPDLESPEEPPPATGVFVNYLQTEHAIFVPQYARHPRENKAALAVMRKTFPDACVTPVECDAVAKGGGALNCITWNVKSSTR